MLDSDLIRDKDDLMETLFITPNTIKPLPSSPPLYTFLNSHHIVVL